MGERERIRARQEERARPGGPDWTVYPIWILGQTDLAAIVAGCAIVIRTNAPYRFGTLDNFESREPFAVMVNGVLYGSLAAAAVACGLSPRKIFFKVMEEEDDGGH